MVLWNQAHYFERRNAGYVYSRTVFGQGFSISERETDLLFRDLKRLDGRFLIEGGMFIVVTTGLFMTGTIETDAPIAWFMFCSIAAVTVLAATAFYRRDRLVGRVLGHRSPDLPRLPFRQALAAPRPSVTKRHAIAIPQSVAVLFGLALTAGDAPAFYAFFVVNRSLGFERFLAIALDNTGLSVALAVFNVALIAGIVFMMSEIRRLRAASELR